VPHSDYRIEQVAAAYRIICKCGWTSKFEPSEAGAIRQWDKHRSKEHD
jgi:hypothetical protein